MSRVLVTVGAARSEASQEDRSRETHASGEHPRFGQPPRPTDRTDPRGRSQSNTPQLP